MAGTTRLELATSAVTVLCRKKHPATLNERERHGAAVFMRVCPLFPARHLYPSGSTRAPETGRDAAVTTQTTTQEIRSLVSRRVALSCRAEKGGGVDAAIASF